MASQQSLHASLLAEDGFSEKAIAILVTASLDSDTVHHSVFNL